MSGDLINQMAMLFGIMAIGYVCNKAGVIDDLACARFSSFLIKVALPANIIASAFGNTNLEAVTVLKVTGIVAGIFIMLPLFSKLVAYVFHLETTYQLMLNYSNLGFMGLPIIASVFGTEYVFYVSIFMMVFNIHIFTVGIMTLHGASESWRASLKKVCNPGVISAVLAFVIVLLKLHAPQPVITICGTLGSVTTPLAMAVIGAQLGQVDLLKVLSKFQLYVMAFFKLIVYPALIFGILNLLFGRNTITEIATILMGLPVAGNVTMLCSEYHGDTPLAAQGTCISTLLSVITVPLMLVLISL